MKICIFYFSGTGNTKKIVDEFSKNFQSRNCDVEVKNIEKYFDADLDFQLDQFDKIGIAYPIHAFNAPQIVLEFAKKLPKLPQKKGFFIIKSSGEPISLNNVSSLKLKSILKHKNLILKNEFHYCMPYNIIFRHSDSMAYRMWTSAEKVIPFDSQEILDGKENKLPYFPFGHFLAWVFRIEHWGGRFNGKRYKVNEKCVQCQMCAKRCPVHNIVVENGEMKFGNKCIMCMRCSFFCPKDAIKIGLFDKWRVNGAYNFQPSQDEEKHKKYCKKSYEKYFSNIEKKINLKN